MPKGPGGEPKEIRDPKARDTSFRTAAIGPPSGAVDSRVDQALADSFPASDPPPWTLGAPRWSSHVDRDDRASKARAPRRSSKKHSILEHSVRDVMRSDVHWLPSDMPLEMAADELARRHVTGAPVCAPDGRIVGILSGSDLTRYFGRADDERRVEDVMTRAIVSVGPDDTLEHVVQLMVLERVHRVLVVDPADHLLGLVSSMDVLRELAGLSRLRAAR